MRKTILSMMLVGAVGVGGCASGYGQNPLGSILGSVLGGVGGGGAYPNQSNGGYNNQQFQQAAVNACGAQAQQYGRVNINNVQARSSSTLRVYGTVEVNNGYQRRGFECDFRSDGRITDFDLT